MVEDIAFFSSKLLENVPTYVWRYVWYVCYVVTARWRSCVFCQSHSRLLKQYISAALDWVWRTRTVANSITRFELFGFLFLRSSENHSLRDSHRHRHWPCRKNLRGSEQLQTSVKCLIFLKGSENQCGVKGRNFEHFKCRMDEMVKKFIVISNSREKSYIDIPNSEWPQIFVLLDYKETYNLF